MNKAIEKLIENLDLSEEEKAFLKTANYANTAEANQVNVISNFYLSKSLQDISDNIIKSNKETANRNSQLSKVSLYLTAALVFVGITQVAATINNLYVWIAYFVFSFGGILGIRSALKK